VKEDVMMTNQLSETTKNRKNEHIDICLQQNVNAVGITSGFEKYQFQHNALPELNFSDINLHTQFLNKKIQAPFLISSMTGGTQKAWEINQRLAEAAENKGWAMGIGSIRAAIEDNDLSYSYNIRKFAPTVPLIANLGAVQLNYGYNIEQCRKAIDIMDADALVLHLNSMQEVFQPEGNTNFKDLLSKIKQICRQLEVPVGVKEVGWGINGKTAIKLADAGVDFIDIAGAGGTSWSQVEKYRSKDSIIQKAAEAFKGWGNPTSECIVEVRNCLPQCTIIGSGGIQNGLDAAKAICLGSDLAGFGRSLLNASVQSEEHLYSLFEQLELELKIAMFGIGVQDIVSLKKSSLTRI
jgi:isopentenyl-diphosphate delta-isomerase